MHLLMPNLDTFSVMFLESLDVLGLATSYVLLQITQPGLIRPHLVSRWLSPSMPKRLKDLATERAANLPQGNTLLSNQPVTDQSCILKELPLKGFFQAIFPGDCELQQH